MRVVLELATGDQPISGTFSRPDIGESVAFSGTLELLALLEAAVTTGLQSAAPAAPTAPATSTVTPSLPDAAPGGSATGGAAPVAPRAGDGAQREVG